MQHSAFRYAGYSMRQLKSIVHILTSSGHKVTLTFQRGLWFDDRHAENDGLEFVL